MKDILNNSNGYTDCRMITRMIERRNSYKRKEVAIAFSIDATEEKKRR